MAHQHVFCRVKKLRDPFKLFRISARKIRIAEVKRTENEVWGACRAEKRHCVLRIFEKLRCVAAYMKICTSGKYRKCFMCGITAHIRTAFQRMKRLRKKFQICSVRVVNYERHIKCMARIGNRPYIKHIAEIIGRRHIYRRRQSVCRLKCFFYVACRYITAA